jgi:CDP-glycerol glycerophosphotransferase (TagB/SpsB family)
LQVYDGHDTLPLLLDADALLCDTSSIISEFALLRKPVVTFRNLAPQPYMIDVATPAGVGPALELALSKPAGIIQAIDQHALDTHPWNDGCCSQRIIAATDRLVEQGLGHLKPKPRNLIRHLKMRKDLDYFRLR